MGQCEFEEREYESALYPQIQGISRYAWAPGQVLEAQVGFDFSVFSRSLPFWALQGHSAIPPGYLLTNWGHGLQAIKRPLPNFSLNLFIQAKRPSYVKNARKLLKQKGLGSPHWKFSTQAAQQARLNALSNAVGEDGLVCYASPAFHRVTQLYDHMVNGTVVENSTFPSAGVLNSPHKAWNYSQPGTVGIANSTPENIEEPPLMDQLERLLRERSASRDRSMANSLDQLAREVRQSATSIYAADNPVTVLFSARAQQIDAMFGRTSDIELDSAIRDFLHVHNYAYTYQMLWLTLGTEESPEPLQA